MSASLPLPTFKKKRGVPSFGVYAVIQTNTVNWSLKRPVPNQLAEES